MKDKLEKILLKSILSVPKSKEEIYSLTMRIVYHPIALFFY